MLASASTNHRLTMLCLCGGLCIYNGCVGLSNYKTKAEIWEFYIQTKKTVNAENIPGMCVLTNRARDLVTVESEWVSQSRN